MFGDSALVVDLVELDRYALANALLLHGHSIQHVRYLHRPLRMRNNNKLRLLQKFLHDQIEALVVGFVEGGIDFVEDAEGGGFGFEDGHEEGDAGHGFFAAGKLGDGDGFFAGGMGNDFDAGVEGIDGFFHDGQNRRAIGGEGG